MADGSTCTLTPEQIDREVRAVYTGPLKYGDIARAGRRLGLTSQQMYGRAMALGLQPAHTKAAPWTADELALLEDTAHLSITESERRFKRAGYERNWHAIQIMRVKQQFLSRDAREGVGLWTTPQLAKLLGVDDDTVRRWVTLYGLKAESRGTEQSRRYLVAEKDLRRWLANNSTRVHPGRIPHAAWPWFVEMLSGLAPRGMAE